MLRYVEPFGMKGNSEHNFMLSQHDLWQSKLLFFSQFIFGPCDRHFDEYCKNKNPFPVCMYIQVNNDEINEWFLKTQ